MRKVLKAFAILPLLMAQPASAQSDAEVCASLLPRIRDLATQSQAFSNEGGAMKTVLPNNLRTAERTAEAEQQARDAATALPGAISSQMGELGAAVIRLQGPLEDYNRRVLEVLGATELCAAGG